MKKLNFSFFILLAAFLFSSNAFGIEGNIDVSGKIVAPSCALSIEGAEVDFGDDIVRTNIPTDYSPHEGFVKEAILKVTDCAINSSKAVFVQIASSETVAKNQWVFLNSIGDEYAKNVHFEIRHFESEEAKIADRASGVVTGGKYKIPMDYSTGEGTSFLRIVLFNYSGNVSTGLIKASLTATLTVP